MADIFISYKSERRAAAEHLAEVLELYGYSVWYDYALAKGADFGRQIERELRAAHTVVVLWCELSRESPWVLEEAHLAKELGTFTPTWLQRVTPPLGFGRDDTIDLSSWDGAPRSHALDDLIETIAAATGRPAQLDAAAAAKCERIWRRYGAPSLSQFALEAPLAENETAARLPGGEGAASLAGASIATSPERASAAWAMIKDSLDPRDYQHFIEVFANAPESFDARRHRTWLEDWAALDRSDRAALDAFARLGVFESLAATASQAMEELNADQPERFAPQSVFRDAMKSDGDGPEIVAAGTVFRDKLRSGGDGPEMVAIPRGRFLMGSPEGVGGADERPQHEVRVPPFAIGRFAVTFDEYDAYCAATGAERPDDRGWGRGRRPVIYVSWDDAQRFCDWLSDQTGAAYRLPSEAEWEYACRAGTTTAYAFGHKITPQQANFGENFEGGRTSLVGSYPPNEFGLHDMHGNVREWCADARNNSYVGAPDDGSAWTTGDASQAVLRGGSWNLPPAFLRSASRRGTQRDDRSVNVGFRVSRTLAE